MAATGREPDPSLISPAVIALLYAEPQRFSFFQAVRLLQRLAGVETVGHFHALPREAVRFSAQTALTFPVSEVHDLITGRDTPPVLRTHFLGLVGAVGVLPTFYTSLVMERVSTRDNALRDFLDIFHHRIISLFYRAWEKNHFAIPYERDGKDSLTPHLFDLIGLGTPGLKGRQALPDPVFLNYLGLLCQAPRSASALQQILEDYFEVPVEVQAFAGLWRKLTASSRSRLGEEQGVSGRLAAGTVLGTEVWDQQSMIRIRLGPLTLEQYKQFLPDGDAFQPLKNIQRFFCGEDVDAELQLVLDRRFVPRSSLGVTPAAGPRLGFISWVFSKPLGKDADETILRLWEL